MTMTYQDGPVVQTADEGSPHDTYLYTLRQYVMLRRVAKPYYTWAEVMDWTATWFRVHPELDPDDRMSYHYWTAEIGLP